jgi:hypothetical protein
MAHYLGGKLCANLTDEHTSLQPCLLSYVYFWKLCYIGCCTLSISVMAGSCGLGCSIPTFRCWPLFLQVHCWCGGSCAPVSYGWLWVLHSLRPVHAFITVEHLCWIKDDKFSSLCVIWDWQDDWMSKIMKRVVSKIPKVTCFCVFKKLKQSNWCLFVD